MRKILQMVVILFTIYFVFQIVFTYFDGGHDINYEVNDGNNVIKVNEVLKSGLKNDNDNYTLKLTINDNEFDVFTYNDFMRNSHIIDLVKYYSDSSYNCIFIRYRNNKILNDVLCNNSSDNTTIAYHSIANTDTQLDTFVSTLSKYGYDETKWADDLSNKAIDNKFTVYLNNFTLNQYIGLSYTNGFYRINKVDYAKYIEIYDKNITSLDQVKLNGFVSNKYVTYKYGEKTATFSVQDFNDSGNYKFTTSKELSSDTYTLGIHGSSLYAYDPVNQKEYEIDYKAKNVLEVGNADTGILYYSDNKWQRASINSDIASLKFIDSYEISNNFAGYDKVLKVGNTYGYYYLFKRLNNVYYAYRSIITNPGKMTFLFTTSDIDNIIINDDYIYYIDGQSIKCYSDETGNRTLATSSVLLQNPLLLGVYTTN